MRNKFSRDKFDAKIFCDFETKKDAQNYLYNLPPKERLKVWTVIPALKWNSALQLRDAAHPDAPELWELPIKDALLYLGNKSRKPTTQRQANQLYRTIYNLMWDAKDQAKDEGVPLCIVMGEYHLSRTDLMVTNMVTSIAKKLGIDKIGIEGGYEKAGDFPNFSELLSEANQHVKRHDKTGEVIPEKAMSSAMPQRLRQSQIFQLEAALEAGYIRADIFDADEIRDTGKFKDRWEQSASKLAQCAREGKSCLSIHGGMHLTGVAKTLLKDMAFTDQNIIPSGGPPYVTPHTLLINTSHHPFNWRVETDNLGKLNNSWLADAEILTNRNFRTLATGDNLIQIMTPGGEIRDAQMAFDLAREAERAFDLACAKNPALKNPEPTKRFQDRFMDAQIHAKSHLAKVLHRKDNHRER